jgi:hypothetical protein
MNFGCGASKAQTKTAGGKDRELNYMQVTAEYNLDPWDFEHTPPMLVKYQKPWDGNNLRNTSTGNIADFASLLLGMPNG